MKKLLLALILFGALISSPLLAQERKGMPMGGGRMGMKSRMGETRKGMGGMTKAKGMMKSNQMKSKQMPDRMKRGMGRARKQFSDSRQAARSGKATNSGPHN